MFDRWKNFGKMLCSEPGDGSLDNLSAEKFRSLLDKMDCDNAPVTGEELLKYIVENQRRDLFQIISVEDLIRMAYAPLIRGTGTLSGTDFFSRDRARCRREQLDLLDKAAANKSELFQPCYDHLYLHQTAVFEICRRNDAELLQIYLDRFDGYCPAEIYDVMFDYFIYMYLPEWNLLEKYNKQNNDPGDDPGCLSRQKNIVSAETQQHLLDLLIRQAEKCGAQRPDVLQILFRHGLASTRSVFPVRRPETGFGMEFSTRETYDTMCAVRILLHYNGKDLAGRECIAPWGLKYMLMASSCGFPVTCSCGFAGDAGIETPSESWILGKQARLYIPLRDDIYFLRIENRIDFLKELSLMLRHAVRILQCHARWQKAGTAPPDHNEDDDDGEMYASFLPYGTTLSDLRNLCKKIAAESNAPENA